MKRVYTVFISVLCFLALEGATIRGVVDSPDGPVDYALVHIKGTNYGISTKKDGSFEIKNVELHNCVVITTCVGHVADTTRFSLAQDEVKELKIFMRHKEKQLSEVTVTGTMKEVSLAESPVAIEVITPKLFEKNPTPNIFESLNMINGVRPQLQCNICNTGDIHINGMEGPYTMVMIDGMPIISALGSVYGLMGIPNSIIQRVEVQKGPASTLYGSEAVGGLINIITKNPNSASKFALDLMGTSYNEYSLDVAAKYKIGNRVTALASANLFDFDRKWDLNRDNFTDVTLQKRIAVFNKFSYKHQEGNYSNLVLRYYYEDRWGGELGWNKNFRAGDSIYGESIYTSRFEALGNSPLNFIGKNFNFQYSFIWHNQNSAYGKTLLLADQKISFAQITKNFNIANHDFLVGTAIRYTFYDDNTCVTKDLSDNTKTKPQITLLPGVFIQDEIKVNPYHILLLGVRYDLNSLHGSIFSPRLNWKYNVDDNNIFRLSIGNGYRVVNVFSEDHAAYNGSREVVIMPNLKPEQSWNATINYSLFKAVSHGIINLEANVFFSRFSNKIVPDYSDPNKVIFDNLAGYGINRGIGAQMSYSFIAIPVKVMVGSTYAEVYTMEMGVKNVQIQTPFLTSNFLISYNLSPINTNIDLSGNVYSPMKLPVLENDYRPDTSPWYSLINIQISKQFSDRLSLYAGCKNLLNFFPKEDPLMRAFDPFDKHVSDPQSNPNGYTFDTGYNYAPLQGIRFFIGLKYKLS